MKSVLQELLAPVTLEEFSEKYLYRQPYAEPFKAKRFVGYVSWRILWEIFSTGHTDGWLPDHGKLDKKESGRMSFAQAVNGFAEGRTVLVRHAEKSHPKIKEIADDFFRQFKDPIDVQLYCTPADRQGFDWHYDLEEVFVIQTTGEKEFYLRRNAVSPPPARVEMPKDPVNWFDGPEIRCHLKAGDWLYIPAGYWHKARAVTDSIHLSIGVKVRGE